MLSNKLWFRVQYKKNMKNFLVTGATGFIGYHLVKRLISKRYSVIGIDNNSRGRINRFSQEELKKFTFIQCDIRELDSLLNIDKNIDCVIHLAYVNGTENFYNYPDKVLDVGIRGLLNVLDFCKIKNVKNLFLASSSEVLGNPKNVPTDENCEINISDISNPRFSYGGGKILYELFGKNYMPDFFKKLVIFRPFNVYGPKMDTGHVVPDFLKKIKSLDLNNKQIDFHVSGNIQQTRSFEYIDDFIDGLEILLEKGETREIYNIGNDEEVTIETLIRKIFSLISSDNNIKIIEKNNHQGSPQRRCPNINKLKKLGYVPKINLELGLKKTISSWKL